MNEERSPRPHLSRRFAVVAVAIAVAGLLARFVLLKSIARLDPPNWHIFGPDIFYYLTGKYEPLGLGFIAAGAILFSVLGLVARKSRPVELRLAWWQVILLALAVFLFCWWSTSAFYQRFPSCLDESAAFFQAGIFESGHIEATLPPALHAYRGAIIPEFMQIHPDDTVVEAYLPVYSALLALSKCVLGSRWLLNPLLAGASVLLIFGLARNLKLSPLFSGWAVVFLVTSSQFLVNGMSAYAMTSHLFFSLAWLFFYTHPDKRLYYLCPPLGILAIGLHQPFCHILFVLPFLLRLVLDRRWLAAGYSAAVYLVGGLGWLYWIHVMRPEDAQIAAKVFAVPGAEAGFIFLLSMLVLLSWQSVLMTLGFVGALARLRTMPPFFRDLLLSFVITVIFYVFYVRGQGTGWGYRYVHQVLGNLVLIAAWGAAQYSISRINFAALTLVALGLQLPYRCHEVSEAVGRPAAAYAALSHIDADYVILDRGGGWAVQDLMRNRPDFTNRPLFLFRAPLSDEQFRDLMDNHKAVYLSRDELARIGVFVLKK
jgi:hypothetical protein